MHRSTTTTNPIDVDWSHTTSLAQRQSAGLIILRSADQNPQEVVPGVAQRLARGAHNPEVIGSIPIPGRQLFLFIYIFLSISIFLCISIFLSFAFLFLFSYTHTPITHIFILRKLKQ